MAQQSFFSKLASESFGFFSLRGAAAWTVAGVAAYLYIVVPAQKEEKQAMSDLLPKPIATLQHLHKLKNQHLSIKAEVQGMQLQIRREHARRRALEKGDLEFERRTGGHLQKE